MNNTHHSEEVMGVIYIMDLSGLEGIFWRILLVVRRFTADSDYAVFCAEETVNKKRLEI